MTRRTLTRTAHALQTVLSLGLNIVIAKLASRAGPAAAKRWRLVIWALIAVNEIRGVAVAAEAVKHGALMLLR